MKKEYKEILTELCNNPDYYELNTFIGELRIHTCITDFAVFETVFDCLKKQEDSVLEDIEEIFKRNKWTDGFQLIQRKRKEIGDFINETPFLFAVKKPTSFFTGREEKIEQIHKIISQNIEKNYNHRDVCSIVISGLGGTGKTELILSYIHKFKHTFDSIIWINAESETALTTSFNNLALELNITLENLNFETTAKKVAQKISTFGSKSLFVFDNVDETNPNQLLPANFKNHFFLITSRHQYWKDSKIIKLEELTEEEAVNFVKTSMRLKENEEMDGIREFVSALEYFPLALTQATSYIKMKNKLSDEKYSFKEYVTEIEANAENAKKLLRFVPEDILSNGTSKATMLDTITTCQITFNKLKSMQYNQVICHEEIAVSEHVDINTTFESLPSKILNISAYLLSDNIPVRVFLELANQNEDELIWAIDILENYSLIKIHEGMMKINKLFQQVIQFELLDTIRCEEFIGDAVDLFVRKFPLYDRRLEKIYVKRTLMPHLMQLKVHVVHYEQYQQNKKKFFNMMCSLVNCIIDICYDMGEPTIRKNISEELLSIQEKHYMSDCPEIASTIGDLANAFGELGDSQTMKLFLERALKIQELHYGPDHFQIAITLGNLANAFGDLGDPKTMKSLLERALKIQERHYGPEHFQLAITLSNLANAFGDLGDSQTMKLLLERALKIQEHHYGLDHFQVAITLGNLANAFGDLGDSQTKKSLLERALKIQEHHYGTDHFQVAITLGNLANAFGDMGDSQTMKLLLERALKIQERHYGPDHFQVARTLGNLANAFGDLGDSQTMKLLLERALKIQERYYGPDHFQLGRTLGNLANAFGDLGDFKMMKLLLERALKIQELHYGPDHFQVAIILGNLANAFGDLGDFKTMKSLLERALKIQELHYGPDHFQVAITLSNLANAFGGLGDFKMMKLLLERALKIQEYHYGPDHFQVAITLGNLANAFGDLRDSEMKKSLLERALKIQEYHYGPDHFQVAITLGNLANVYGDLGDSEMKKSLLERALKIQECHYGPHHFQVAITLGNLANVYGDLGDSEMKKSLLERTMEIEENHYGPDHFRVAKTLENLANTLDDMGNSQTKKTLLERALAIKERHYENNSYEVALTRVYLAMCKINLKQFQGAKELFENVLPIFEQHYGKSHQYTNAVRQQFDDVCQMLISSESQIPKKSVTKKISGENLEPLLDLCRFAIDLKEIDSELIVSMLLNENYLTKDEVSLVRNETLRKSKTKTIFDLLKLKPNNVFIELQKIFYVNEWTDILEHFQDRLKEYQQEDLILSPASLSNLKQFSNYEESFELIKSKLKNYTQRSLNEADSLWNRLAENENADFKSTFNTNIEMMTLNANKIWSTFKIFENFFIDNISTQRYVLHGGPGCGKSTFINQLIRGWYERKEPWTKRFSLIILFTSEVLQKNCSLFDLLTVILEDKSEAVILNDWLKRKENLHKTLFIFDGFDEQNYDLSELLNDYEIYDLSLSTVIITVRNIKSSLCEKEYLHFEIKGYTEDGAGEQLKKFGVSKNTINEVLKNPLYNTVHGLLEGRKRYEINTAKFINNYVKYLIERYRATAKVALTEKEDETEHIKIAIGKTAQDEHSFVMFDEPKKTNFGLSDSQLKLAISVGLIHRTSTKREHKYPHEIFAYYFGAFYWSQQCALKLALSKETP